jgi:hypothetical protein
LLPALSVLGLVSLGYLAGAAVVFFELPSSRFLEKGFTGARAWIERQKAVPDTSDESAPPPSVGKVGSPDKAYDGFTLYTIQSRSQAASRLRTRAMLIDMEGNLVHDWAVAYEQVWPGRSPHVKNPVDPELISFAGCHLYPNGDLLAVFHALGDTPYGYGLVKLDSDSNVLWRYSDNVHHDVDVAEDGTIYALTQQITDHLPKSLDYLPSPCLVDYLVLLDAKTGREKRRIPILEAFLNSPFAAHLDALSRLPRRVAPPGLPPAAPADDGKGDILHTNFVHVLSRKQAPRFPLFKAGQVLISVHQLHTLAVVDTDSGSVIWAARGPWLYQHDAQFLDNGHILLFDNFGSPLGSRVLEYDPQTQAIPWWYAGENHGSFVTPVRGLSQRLPNGNTLVVDSALGTLLEVTPGKETVWSCSCHAHVPFARRYGPEQVPFLTGGSHAGP